MSHEKVRSKKHPFGITSLGSICCCLNGYSEEERILAYRFGWYIFSSNRQHFEDFSNFIRRRKWFINLSLVYPHPICFFQPGPGPFGAYD